MAVQQRSNAASLEQLLRVLAQLAQTPAFSLEMGAVAAQMGSLAFHPGSFFDAAGSTFTLSMDDTTYGDPRDWVPMSWMQVFTNEQQLRPVPPYPILQLFGGPGRAGTNFDTDPDTDIWWYAIDLVTMAQADYPSAATQMAFALAKGMERLIRRNTSLGGLCYYVYPETPPTPGGEIETEHVGILSGVLQRYSLGCFVGPD